MIRPAILGLLALLLPWSCIVQPQPEPPAAPGEDDIADLDGAEGDVDRDGAHDDADAQAGAEPQGASFDSWAPEGFEPPPGGEDEWVGVVRLPGGYHPERVSQGIDAGGPDAGP